MRDVLPTLRRWYDGGAPYALPTVVAVSNSAPRQPGAVLAVGPDGEVVGSVSDRSLWAEALPAGGRRHRRPRVLRSAPHLVTPVPCDDAGSAYDVDTAADLAALASEDLPCS